MKINDSELLKKFMVVHTLVRNLESAIELVCVWQVDMRARIRGNKGY